MNWLPIGWNACRKPLSECPPNAGEITSDMWVVAQSLAHGVPLLSTNNLNTIDHDIINAWLRSDQGFNHDFILGPGKSVHRLLDWNMSKTHECVIAHATTGRRKTTQERQKQVVGALGVLSATGFPAEKASDLDVNADAFASLKFHIRNQLMEEQDFDSLYERAMGYPHRATAAATEIRLNDAVNITEKFLQYERERGISR